METEERTEHGDGKRATWGPKLFYVALIGTLLFFWWLVIYDHGVVPHH